jgi:poly(A) polymerase/tRNA nucleotidyltransferase (CCA-adding enzyme)
VDIRPPDSVLAILERLWASGHAGYVVGGSLRDILLGREAHDWDLASDARPERVQELFPGTVYENAFGTVAIREGGRVHELTTFRTDHDYADFRRPHRVEFGDRIELDLARRDFTVNAMAWGAEAPLHGETAVPALVDPHGGLADLALDYLRAVGDPLVRFEEDALRMVRAVRLATTLDLDIEAATLAAIQATAPLVGHLSGERISTELQKLLAAPEPSRGLRLVAATGMLAVLWPDLAAQQGVPQNKIPGDDLWDHTLRTVDAAPPDRPVVRLAALLHDIGKPATMADGHFLHHDRVGAELAMTFLDRLHVPRATAEQVVHLVRAHMFTYDPTWGDAGVRRFIKRIGRDSLEPLFALREADNVGSGQPPDGHRLDELRRRVNEQLEGDMVLERGDLAIDGDDLIAELGLSQGPRLGRIIDALVERAIADPAINDRPTLLLLAQSMLADEP